MSPATPGGSYVNKAQFNKWAAEQLAKRQAAASETVQDSQKPRPCARRGIDNAPRCLERLRAAQTDETKAKVDVSLSKSRPWLGRCRWTTTTLDAPGRSRTGIVTGRCACHSAPSWRRRRAPEALTAAAARAGRGRTTGRAR